MQYIFNFFAKLINEFGVAKLNTACDWVLYQEKEQEILKKYKKY